MPSKKRSTRNKKSAVSPPSTQTFQFINFTDAPYLDEDDRDIVRIKAISDYHQRKRNNNPRTSVESTNHSLKPSMSTFRLLPQAHVADSRIVSPTVQQVRLEQEIHATSFGSQLLPASSSNTRVTIGIDFKLDNETGLPPVTTCPSFDVNKMDYDKAVQPYLPPHRKPKEDSDKKVDLLAMNLDSPLNIPISSSPKMQLWIHHYFNDRNLASLLMVSVRKSWLQTSLQDPAFFAAVASHYAGRYSLGTGQGDPTDSLLLRMEAIRIVNEKLNQPDEFVSDGTIGAVASLVTYESNNGTLNAIRTHLAGLRRMIDIRGGFENAGFPPSLQRLIRWAELTAINVLSTLPIILSPKSPGRDMHPQSHIASSDRLIAPIQRCPDYDIDFTVVPESISDIFANLRCLSSVLEAKAASTISSIDTMWYSDKVYLVQKSLVSLSIDPNQEKIHTACFIAGSIYVDSYLRDLSFHSRIISLMVSKLKRFLEENVMRSFSGYGEADLVLIFWTLIIGGISAMGKPERTWFVEQLRIVAQVLNLHTMNGAEATLGKIVWSADWRGYLERIYCEVIEGI